MTLPDRAPDYELVIPSSGSGIDELVFTGGVTIPAEAGTVKVGVDSVGPYITPTSGTVARFTSGGDYDEWPDAVQVATEFVCEFIHLGSPSQGNASAIFRAGVYPRVRMFHRPGVPGLGAIPYSYDVLGAGTEWISGGGATGYRRFATVDTFPQLDIEVGDPYAGDGTGITVPVSNAFGTDDLWAGSPWYLQLDQGVYHEIRCYAARVWITQVEDPSALMGMYGFRQRQSIAGNPDGWPLRQRQNGGHTGTWPLRQRQTGI